MRINFSANCNTTNISGIVDINKHLMKKHEMICLKCITLNNEACFAGPIPIKLNPNELHHYPFMVNLDRCNILLVLSSRKCLCNKAKDVNLNVFNMIRRINESKTLKRHLSCDCKCKFDGRRYNLNQKRNNDQSQHECKTQ